jgi:hypothetical protein
MFAAECLWHHCPEQLRGELRVIVGVFALSGPLEEEAESFLKQMPCVSVLWNPVKVPLGIFNLPPGVTRHRLSRAFGLVRRGLDRVGVPPGWQTRLTPMIHDHLGLYLQEYLIHICRVHGQRSEVGIIDADFFVWDGSFFDVLRAGLEPDTFAAGWLERYDDGATLDGKNVFPVGSECFLIQPKKFNELNWQVGTIDRQLQTRLLTRRPGIAFQRDMVDTLYQACWEAQFAGLKITYPFRGMKTCHVGGFGHADASYIRDSLARGTPDGEASAQFWIQRIRLNERVASALARRYGDGPITAGLGKIHERAGALWQNEVILRLADKTPPSEDEVLFEKILAELTPGLRLT